MKITKISHSILFVLTFCSFINLSTAAEFEEDSVFCCLPLINFFSEPHNEDFILDPLLGTEDISDGENKNFYETKLSLPALPIEVLSVISTYLNPSNLTTVSSISSLMKMKINNGFWKQYNSFKDYKSWNLSLPEMKISYGYYWYQNNKLENASQLGYPKAIVEWEKKKSNQKLQEGYQGNYDMQLYDNYEFSGHKSDFLKRKLIYSCHGIDRA